MEKRGGAWQRNVVENGEVEVPFIGLERRGGGRSEELDGGRGVRFEVGRFKDEGDTVWRQFIGQKEGGQAALRFHSPRVEGGAASGAGSGSLTRWAHLSVRGRRQPNRTSSEREPMAEPDKRSRPGLLIGWTHLSVRGRRRADWAGQGGRRWAAAGLEKKRGGRAETISRAEIK
jgi:hypothetical protein